MASNAEPPPSDNPTADPSPSKGPIGPPPIVLTPGGPTASPYIPHVGMQVAQPGSPLIVQTVSQQIWQGPFPPPEAVREYEKILPGCFNRLITMAEQSQSANIRTIERAQDYTRDDIKRGHFLGAGVTALAMVGCVACVLLHAQVVAGFFLAVPVMAVAQSLINSRRTKHDENSDSSSTTEPPGDHS